MKNKSRIKMTVPMIIIFFIIAFMSRRTDHTTSTSEPAADQESLPQRGEAQATVPKSSLEEASEDRRTKPLKGSSADRSARQQRQPTLPAAHSNVLEPSSDTVFRKRIIEIFPIAYLTLMAIIQGAAFGLVLISVQHDLSYRSTSLQIAITLSQAFAVGLAVVIVTHQYLMLTAIECWVPTISDTFIPYLIGFSEIWMGLSVGHDTSWWTALSAMSFISGFAFWYTRIRTADGVFPGKRIIYQQHCRSIVIQIFLCMIMFAVSAITATMNARQACPAQVNVGLTWVVIGIGLAILMQGSHDQNRIYDEYGVPRWRYHNDRNRDILD